MSAGTGQHRANAVQRALAHPVRAKILTELRKRPASPSQLADMAGVSVGVVSYHIRILAEAGLAELVGTVPKRGAVQHFYAARASDALGVTLMLDERRAESLLKDLQARVEAARRSAEEKPGDVPVVIVGHVVPPVD
ncbi:MAG TPA: winged helix-turn-helix domain-containing protein [Capillimicrobium sp.]|nr:winged helix-turn-helix domain-containing protein [Capillimicrobium sp.]